MGVEVKSGGESLTAVVMMAAVMDTIQAGAPVGVPSVVHW